MSKLKELLKKLGLKDDQIEVYLSTEEVKTKDLDPDKDSQTLIGSIKDVLKNDLEPEIKKEAEKNSRAHIYGEVEKAFMKEGGFKKEDIGVAEPKWTDYLGHFKKSLTKEPAGDDKTKKTITDLQESLRVANEAKEKAENAITEASTKYQKDLEDFKVGIKREATLVETIGKFEKKTILPPNKVLKLIGDKLNEKYSLVQEADGSFGIRDKADPNKKVNKSATEFMTLNDALEGLITEEDLFAKSNGGEGKKAEGAAGGSGGGTPPPERKLPASAMETEEENSKL